MERMILYIALIAGGYVLVYLLLKKKIAKSLDAATILDQVRDEVGRIVVELNQTTNRNITLIEDRINALSELLSKADKKIALIRREAEKQEIGARLYTELAAKRQETPKAEPAPDPAQRQEEALRLARSGASPAVIAKRLGLTLGEVELIISLAERRHG